MYRAGIEWILGFRCAATPSTSIRASRAPGAGFEIRFRYHATRYEIAVENPLGVARGVARVEHDGVALPAASRSPC